MIDIDGRIRIDEAEISLSFIRASGPGGQNVNRVETAVQLRFDARASRDLPDWLKERLVSVAGRRLTRAGEIVITARRHRTQEGNRADAVKRLVALLREAAHRDAVRVPTKPTLGSKKRRLDGKRRQSERKTARLVPDE